MSPSNWHEELRRTFAKTPLPRNYTERLLVELLDHFADLTEEDHVMSTDAISNRLGSPQFLANRAVAEFRQRTFAGRHPVLTFLVAPIPCTLLCIAATLFVVFALGSLIPDEAIHEPSNLTATSVGLATFTWSLRLIPFAFLAFLFSRIAYRSGSGWRWGMAASLLIAVLAAGFSVDYHLPTLEPNSGTFMLGLAVPPGLLQLLQFAIPAGIAMWLARRHAAAPALN
jgi:hypothetical protein